MTGTISGGALVRVGESLLRFSREVVVRVAARAGVTRLAGLPRGVAGIMVERGVVVPVVDASVVGAAPTAAWILILRLEDSLMGVPVDDLDSLETQEEVDTLDGAGDASADAETVEPASVWERAVGPAAGRARA